MRHQAEYNQEQIELMSEDELFEAMLDLDNALANVKESLERAKSDLRFEGVVADREWFHKAKYAKRKIAQTRQRVQYALGKRRKQTRREAAAAVNRQLVISLKRRVSPELFAECVEETKDAIAALMAQKSDPLDDDGGA